MIDDIYNFLVSQAATALAVTVVKAFPNFLRPTLVPPMAALEIASLAMASNRIGQKSARHALGLRLYVFAANEVSLAQMLESVLTLEQQILSATVAGQRVDFSFADGQRHQNQSGTEEEDHGFSFFVTATYKE